MRSPEDRDIDAPPSDATMVRSEEELHTETVSRPVGTVRVSKQIDTYPIDQVVERRTEEIDDAGERVPVAEGDSGEIETLPDGSVSIPILEEELVVTKRVVVRERLVVRKRTVVDEHRIETELRRERVDVEVDPAIEDRVDRGDTVPGTPPPPPNL